VINSLTFEDNSSLQTGSELTVTSGDITVPNGTAILTGGTLITPQDLNSNGGNGATLISNTPLNAGGGANINGGTLELQDNLTTGGNVNVNPGSSLVVDPSGSVNAGGDVNLNNSTAAVQGDLGAGSSINIGPGSEFVVAPGMVNADDSVQVADDAALIVDGELNTPTTSISDGGGLAGTGVINGNVDNSGVVVPGDPISNSTGTLTINGNYTQNQNGTFR
jgi:hypothetical protein